MRLKLITLFLALVVLAGCNKSSESFQGYWDVVSIESRTFDNGYLIASEFQYGNPGDAFNFKSNGIVDISMNGFTDTYYYTNSGSYLTIDNDQYDITYLSGDRMTLFARYEVGFDTYVETEIQLSR